MNEKIVPVELLPKLCAEIIEWQDVGCLPTNNEFHKFADSLAHVPESQRMRVAESMVHRAAMKLAAAPVVAVEPVSDREQFERWFKGKFGDTFNPFERDVDRSRQYANEWVQARWEAWQAAQSKQPSAETFPYSAEAIVALEAVGMGKPGKPNTLISMIHEAIEEIKTLRGQPSAANEVVDTATKILDYLLSLKFEGDIPDEIFVPFMDAVEALRSKS